MGDWINWVKASVAVAEYEAVFDSVNFTCRFLDDIINWDGFGLGFVVAVVEFLIFSSVVDDWVFGLASASAQWTWVLFLALAN